MLYYLRQGMTLAALFFTVLSFAEEKKAPDLAFQTIPNLNVTSNACYTPVFATYTIVAGAPAVTLQSIKLDVSDSVTSIVPSPSKSCEENKKLTLNETCNITLMLQPCGQNTIDRELIINISTTQGALKTSISTQVTNLLQITAGNGANNSPLLVDSQDNGITWKDVSSSVPNMPNLVMFNTAACNIGATCIVAGQDNTGTSGNYPPLLITTLNSGADWSLVTQVFSNNELIEFPTLGRFDGGSCSGNNCIAVGINISDDSPILFNSINAGADWYQRSINNGPAIAELYGGSCSGDLCIVVGSDLTSNPSLPLLTSSIDGGVTWNRITTLQNNVPFPANSIFNESDPSCSDTICIAGGIIQDFSSFPPVPPHPFLISAVNSVSSWNQVSTVNNGLPAAGNFNGYSCSGKNCVAVGHNQTDQNILIVNTTNNGSTWNRVTTLSDGSALPSGFLYQVSCSNNNCIASGGLLLLSSTDGGASWKKITTASGDQGFPTNGVFNSVGCTGNVCLAAGGDITNPPYLLTSFDGGITWNNVKVGQAGLPAGGDLNTVSISR